MLFHAYAVAGEVLEFAGGLSPERVSILNRRKKLPFVQFFDEFLQFFFFTLGDDFDTAVVPSKSDADQAVRKRQVSDPLQKIGA